MTSYAREGGGLEQCIPKVHNLIHVTDTFKYDTYILRALAFLGYFPNIFIHFLVLSLNLGNSKYDISKNVVGFNVIARYS